MIKKSLSIDEKEKGVGVNFINIHSDPIFRQPELWLLFLQITTN